MTANRATFHNQSRWTRTLSLAALAGAMLIAGAATSQASPPRGSDAPRIVLTDTNNAKFDSADFKGHTLFLIFGELTHEKLGKACSDIDEVLQDQRLPKDAFTPVLIIAHEVTPEALKKAAEGGHLPKLVVKDSKRETFGAYQIVVVPSVVVVGPDGKVVHFVPAFSPNFKESLTDAALFAAGKIDAAQFDQALTHTPGTPTTGPEAKASRLTHLARELAKRGMADMAEQRYREALEASPKNSEAMLGLGELLLAQEKLDDADKSFKSALEAVPGSTDAMLGLDAVKVKRGGESLGQAEADIRRIIAGNSKLPRAHYLLGLVHQQKSEHAEAAASFRRAAELFMEPGEGQ